MNNDLSVASEYIKRKIEEIDKQISNLQEEKAHFQYVSNDLSQTFPQNQSLFPGKSFDAPGQANTIVSPSHKYVKDLIIDILKESGKKMSPKQIFSVLQKYRPEIKMSGFRVSLMRVGKDDRYPVSHVPGLFWYEERA